ncbi:MAG: hypothetical protein FJY80_04540, partial [Candidatus Aminicenantes bacterium]|nr:hypothetical protein [Candidatus Aminicenantes bacterium]
MKAKRPVLLITAAVLLLLAAAVLRPWRPSFARLRSGRALNVILVSVDTLRADRLGCYGFRGIRTPTIDGLAAGGV